MIEDSSEGPVIRVDKLSKMYGKLKAVDGVSFDIPEGEIFAFLGPNGAGKTTTVEMIEGIRTPTEGRIFILGNETTRSVSRVRKRIGVLPQEFSSFDKVTVKETIRFFSRLYRNGRDPEDLMELLNLTEHKKKLYQDLSGGLKQRVGIAVALVNDPEMVFLDEPTTGLDPAARQDVWRVIKGLKRDGKTVFLTTHYMEEAQELADHIAIINHGRIVAEGSVDTLIDRYGKGQILTFDGAGKKLASFLGKAGMDVRWSGSGTVSTMIGEGKDLLGILELVRGGGFRYNGINVRRSNLEEVFLTLTGEKLKEGDSR